MRNRVNKWAMMRWKYFSILKLNYWTFATKEDWTVCILGIDNYFPADFASFFYDFSNIFHSLIFLQLDVRTFLYFPWGFNQEISLIVSSTS